MRVLTMEETQQVSGGSCADFEEFLMAAFGGGLFGALAGSRGGLIGAAGGGIFGAALGGAMYLINHDGPCAS